MKPFIIFILILVPISVGAETLKDVLLEVGVPASEIAHVSELAHNPSTTKARSITEWLKAQGVKDIGTLLSTHPQVLSLSIEANLNPKVVWLEAQGVKDIGKLLSTLPQVLGYSIEENLNPKVVWLKAQGVKDIGKLLSTFPAVLSYSIEENLNPKVAWLKAQGVKDIGKVLSSSPQVLSRSIEENLNPKVAWLKAQGVKDIGKVLSSFPQVLGLSIEENLEPTLRLLKDDFRFKIEDIEQTPMLLGASLSRLQLIADWIEAASISMEDIPLGKRKEFVSRVSVRDIASHLLRFLDFIRARTSPENRLEILEQVLPELEAHQVVARVFVKKGKMPKIGAEECATVLEHLINEQKLGLR